MVNGKARDRKGNTRAVVSKRWPDGSRFRRYVPNVTVGKKLLARIDESIAMGTWAELKSQLTEGPPQDYTVAQFADIYLEDYCKLRNTRPDFKKETLSVITEIVGAVKLRQFTASDANTFEKERSRTVSGATVNRGLAVLSNMFTFARKQGLVSRNPMEGYGRIPVDEKAMRVMEPHQERRIVEETLAVDSVVGAYVGVLGETGLRMEEGLQLKWEFVDAKRRRLTVEASKNYRARYVPVSEYAIQLMNTLLRVDGNPYVFVRLSTMERLRAPRKEFEAGKAAANVSWPGFHDFRHYRATQWLKHGVDIRTVKEWLGHRDIQTTMRYLHFVEGHAQKRFAEAERAELQELGLAPPNG